jgi:hypothetical protein
VTKAQINEKRRTNNLKNPRRQQRVAQYQSTNPRKVNTRRPTPALKIAASYSFTIPTINPFSKKPRTNKNCYEWQGRCLDGNKDERFFTVNAPTGSGKSTLILFDSEYKLNTNQFDKILIAAPQSIIAAGCAKTDILRPDGKRCNLQPTLNLCDGKLLGSTVSQVIAWLRDKHTTNNGKVCLTTHATLVLVYNKLKADNELYLFNRVFTWIDEAHHIKNGSYLINGVTYTNANQIGAFVGEVLAEKKIKKAGLGIVTATMFRGDGQTILTAEQKKKFTSFVLPFDEWFGQMKTLKTFDVHVVVAGEFDYIQTIEKIIASGKHKDIIHIPSVLSLAGIPIDKYVAAKRIDKLLRKHGYNKIMDLVDDAPALRRKNKATLFAKDLSDLDAIIALGMFKEGADWDEADRGIIVGQRGSVVEMLQLFGRVLRDKKEHADIYIVLPYSLNQKLTPEQRQTNVKAYVKQIMFLYYLENIYNPIKLGPKKVKKGGKKTINWFDTAFPDVDVKLDILAESEYLLVDIKSLKPNITTTELYNEFLRDSESLLRKHGAEDHLRDIAQIIYRIMVRQQMREKKLDVNNFKVEWVDQYKLDPLGSLLEYTAKFDIKTISELREIVSGDRETPEYRVKEAEALAAEHKGILPNDTWLLKKGYSALVAAKKRNPEAFAHIPQENLRGQKVEFRVKEAEALAAEHKGILPNDAWLLKNEYSALVSAKKRNPEAFAHIPQENLRGQKVEFHVKAAEALAKKHNNILPNDAWLLKKGHAALVARSRGPSKKVCSYCSTTTQSAG